MNPSSVEIELPFYVYVHKKPSDGKVFYVGKGKGKRAYRTHGRNAKWNSIYKKHGLIVEIVKRFHTESEAFGYEKFLISQIKTKNSSIANFSDGGDGNSGYKFTESQIETLSQAHKKIWMRPGYREKMISKRSELSLRPGYRELQRKISKKRWLDPRYRDLMRSKVRRGKEVHNSRSVTCLETGLIFETARSATDWIRQHVNPLASETGVVMCCLLKQKSFYGFHWFYSESIPTQDTIDWMLSGYSKGGYHYKSRSVICLETGMVFTTATDAASWCGSSSSEISDCCNFKMRHSKGFHFYFKDNPPDEAQFIWMHEGRPKGARVYNALKIKCIDTGEIFDTISEAVKWVQSCINPKANVANIANCCKRGIPKTAYGHKWAYA